MNIEQEINEYFRALCVKLQEIGNPSLPCNAIKPLKQFRIICSVLDDFIKLLGENQMQYQLLEEQLIKYEAECRSHIRIEQRLKLHCENLQEMCEDLQKQESDHRLSITVHFQKNKNYQREISYLKREVDNASKLAAGRTSVMQERTSSALQDRTNTEPTYSRQPSAIQKAKATIQLRINNQKSLHTESNDYSTIMEPKHRSKDERQYSSLERILDSSNLYTRPKSKVDNSKRAQTLHVSQPYQKSKPQIKKY